MIIKYFIEIWSIRKNWFRLGGIILLSCGFLLLCIIGSDSYKTIFLIGLVSSITGGARIFERSKSYLESILKVTYGIVIGIIGGFLIYILTMVVSVFIVLGFKIPITWDNKEFGIIAYSLGTIGIIITGIFIGGVGGFVDNNTQKKNGGMIGGGIGGFLIALFLIGLYLIVGNLVSNYIKTNNEIFIYIFFGTPSFLLWFSIITGEELNIRSYE